MSEFSESYHLREATQEDAVQLLQRAGLNGIVFPSSNGWTSFVPSGNNWEALGAIVQANVGLLLHYSYAEDHGWLIEIYHGVERQMKFQHWWDGSEESVDDQGMPHPSNDPNFDLLAQWIPQSSENVSTLHECLRLDGQDRAYDFAHLIGLEHFKWLSPVYWSHDPAGSRFPGSIEV
ncbi:hypothetical protein ACQ4M4_13265 [Leptolyngbya sp. AN02str]|uniref:hypothetical protein n=1 Tax=Leptolyngbya sp. AN02str TaxID=3423363 RepID=UPI003D31F5E1